MRIGIDARMYRSSVAGIGRYSQNLIKNLLAIDSQNQYVLFMTAADAEEIRNKKLEIRNAKIVVVNIPHYSLAEQIKFAKIIEKENLDLMHFLHFNVPVNYKGKFIVTIHDLTLLFYPQAAKDINFFKHLGFRYVIKKAVRHAAKIIAVSENTKKDITQVFKVKSQKIKVIYEAADDKVFDNIKNMDIEKIKKQYNIDKPVILYVGQFRGHKNVVGLIKAFKKLKKEIPCQLVLLGKKDLNVEIQESLDRETEKGDILMPGFVLDKDLACWYKLADIFVLPSFYEGFGLPGLESMIAGTPVVASNRASLPEIYKDAVLYFDPFDTADIADKIKRVLQNKNLQNKLIENGRRVSREYSWKKTAEETLDLYKKFKSL